MSIFIAWPQRHPAAEAFAEDLEGNDQIGLDHLGPVGAHLARADARGAVPRQELRIAFDIGDQIVHLAGAIRQFARFGTMGQIGVRIRLI